MRATPRLGVSLRDLLPEEEAARHLAAASEPSWPGMTRPSIRFARLSRSEDARVKPGSDAQASRFFWSKSWSRNIRARAPPRRWPNCSARKPPVEPEMFRAVDGISFSVGRGESVGLVGESGCGKSTTSMMVMRLFDQTSGRIMFDGDEIGGILPNAFARLPLRKSIQMVFQDPTDSLNPRFTAARAIADPILQLGGIRGRDALRARCEELARSGRPAGQSARPVPASTVRRTEGPRRHRARHRAASEARHPRRADRGARRLGAGGGAEFAAGPEAVAGHELFVRVARSERGAAVVRSCHRDADRANRRAGSVRTGLGRSAGCLYKGAADGDSASAVAGSLSIDDGRSNGR